MIKIEKENHVYIIRQIQERECSFCSERIKQLIDIEAKKNHMLPRPLKEIKEKILKGHAVGVFLKESAELLVGSCFLHPWSETLVEICSIVVAKPFRHHGNGKLLVEKTTSLSLKKYPLATVFCLTDKRDRPDRAVEVFSAGGFKKVKKNVLPAEVWKWCEIDRCPDWIEGKFPDCKCLAMIYSP